MTNKDYEKTASKTGSGLPQAQTQAAKVDKLVTKEGSEREDKKATEVAKKAKPNDKKVPMKSPQEPKTAFRKLEDK